MLFLYYNVKESNIAPKFSTVTDFDLYSYIAVYKKIL